MKELMKWTLPLAALTLILANASAVPITGSITFDGGVTLNTASAGTATEVLTWTGPILTGNNPFVLTSSGAFASVSSLSQVIFTPDWSFNTTSPILGFWQVGGFTFELLNSAIFSQGGTPAAVTVTGTGVVSGNGFTPTPATWAFSTQDPSAGNPPTFTISAATGAIGAPDGGTTILLLGCSLFGLGVLKQKVLV